MGIQSVNRFSESRGYALKWAFIPQMVYTPAEEEPASLGVTWERFIEPRDCAAEWDGFALTTIMSGEEVGSRE